MQGGNSISSGKVFAVNFPPVFKNEKLSKECIFNGGIVPPHKDVTTGDYVAPRVKLFSAVVATTQALTSPVAMLRRL